MSGRPCPGVVAGIDEAGLGPLLGPLTVGWSAFRARADLDLWRHLGRVLGADPRHDGRRIVVADSKRVFTRSPRGRRRLETAVLAFLAQLDPFGRWPGRARELLALAPPHLRPAPQVLARHPWYAHLPASLPVHQSPATVARHAQRLGRELERRRVILLDAGLRIIPAGELNAAWRETENKAVTLWHLTGGVIAHLWDSFAEQGLTLFVDRLGARRRYAALLEERFPEARLEIVDEGPSLGEYRLSLGPRRMRICFAERCEERALAVALASCLAKYGRELCMDGFNRYFASLQPGLRPTAGYTTDGRRWLEDAGQALARAGVAPASIVRER